MIEFDADSKALWWLNDNHIYFVDVSNPLGLMFGNGKDEFFMSYENFARFKDSVTFIEYVASRFNIKLSLKDKKNFLNK